LAAETGEHVNQLALRVARLEVAFKGRAGAGPRGLKPAAQAFEAGDQ